MKNTKVRKITTANCENEVLIQEYEIISKQEREVKIKNSNDIVNERKNDSYKRSSYLVSLA